MVAPGEPNALDRALACAVLVAARYPLVQVRVDGGPTLATVRLSIAIVSARAPLVPGSLSSLWWGTVDCHFPVWRTDDVPTAADTLVSRLQGLVTAVSQGEDPHGLLTYLGEAFAPALPTAS